jgi:hypothetical protein
MKRDDNIFKENNMLIPEGHSKSTDYTGEDVK